MTAGFQPAADEDPRPEPPRAPEEGECCQSGCVPCIYDLYWEAVDRYEQALRAWQTRHGGWAR
jgi:hypothetical protein